MKTLIISILMFFSINNLVAQKWYVGLNGGLGFPIQKDVVAKSALTAVAIGGGYIKDYETSFGNGIYTDIVIGRKIDSVAFVEFELRYWKSNSVNTVAQGHPIDVGVPPYYVSRRKIMADNMFLNFSYGLKFPTRSKFDFYGKVGIMVGQNFTRDEIVDHNHGYYSRPEFEIVAMRKFKTNYTIGFTSATGFTYLLNNRWKLNCEAFLQLAGARMLSVELVSYTADGKDIIDEVPPENRKTDFYYPKNNTIYDNSEAMGKLTPRVVPLSSLGFKLGVLYLL